MSYISPAFANQNASPGYGAQQTRNAIFAHYNAAVGGVIGSSDWAVTAGGGMSVAVAAGRGLVLASGGGQGSYLCQSVTSNTLTILTSDPTNPRIDTVVAVVTDSQYSGVTDTWVLEVVEGTATSGATLSNLNGKGAVPTNGFVVAYVLVPAGTSTIVSGDLLDSRTWANIANEQLALTTTGDMTYANSATTVSRLALGASGTLIGAGASAPKYFTAVNGYGITGFAFTAAAGSISPAVSLIVLTGYVTGASVSLPTNTPTDVLDTSTLAVGTWDVEFITTAQGSTAASADSCAAALVVKSGTAVLSGKLGASSWFAAAGQQQEMSLRCIAVVDVEAVIELEMNYSGSATGHAIGYSTYANLSLINQTAWIATRLG